MNEITTEEEPAPERKTGFFARLKSGLVKTRNALAAGIENIIHGKAKVGPELLNELEEALLTADVGFHTASAILEELRQGVAANRIRTKDEIESHLRASLTRILEENQRPLAAPSGAPMIVLMVGINGSGKTTTIAKLAHKWKGEGKKLLIAAGDTFRAAAVEQLQIWADRVGVPCVKQKSGADPSAVAYDAVQAGIARQLDIVIIDTAGRLQTNLNLMEELKKIKRVIGNVLPGAPHETLLVLDAGIGQNSISQARLFDSALDISGLVMTKLDGTSKGGVLFNISREMKKPVRFIGIGEKMHDLQEFDPAAFVRALFEK